MPAPLVAEFFGSNGAVVEAPSNVPTSGQVVQANGDGTSTWVDLSTGPIDLTSNVTGILPRNHGGVGIDLTTTGGTSYVVRQSSLNGNITVSQLAYTDISGLGSLATLNAAPASNLTGTTLNATVVNSSLTSVGTIVSGGWHGSTIELGYGGTGADLSATGGTSKVLMQTTVGGAVTVAQLTNSDISGLGTMATQNANNVNISGGTITGLSSPTNPSDAATKSYVDVAVTGLLDFKGTIDASTNPNWPAASKGDAYIVSVAGKLGGASGQSVDVGDWAIATADNAGGTDASVGSSWSILEHNMANVAYTNVANTFSLSQTFSSGIILGAAQSVEWTTRTKIGCNSVNGSLLFTNNAGTDFGLILLGGTTSSFPAIKRSSTGISFRLADDSADTSITTSAITATATGAVSTSTILLTGTPYAGGGGTTNFPIMYLNVSGATAPTTFSSNGTFFGINAQSSFTGTFVDYRINGGSPVYKVDWNGQVYLNSTSQYLARVVNNLMLGGMTGIVFNASTSTFSSPSANTFLLGVDSASPTSQTLNINGVTAGTTNTAGVNWVFQGSHSTGNAAGGGFVWQVTPAGSSGSSVNSYVTVLQTDSTGLSTFTRSGIGSTSSDGLIIQNSTASTAGATVQYGPRLAILGTAWDTSALSSKTLGWYFDVQTASGNPPNSSLIVYEKMSSGSLSLRFSIDNSSLTCVGINVKVSSAGAFQWSTQAQITSPTTATIQLGAADSGSPVAQTLTAQSATGTNIAGPNLTIDAPKSTGSANGGSIILRTSAAGGSGSSQNTLAAVLTLDSTKLATFAGNIVCGSITIEQSTGALYGNFTKLNAQVGTTYTLASSDCGKTITFNNASPITVTLPNSLSAGFWCNVIQTGAGQVTLSAGSGATMNNYDAFTKLAGQKAMATIIVESNSGGSAAVYYTQGRMA